MDRGLRLTAGQLSIGAESMRSLWPLMERLLQRRMGEGPPQIDLVAESVAISGAEAVFPLKQVRSRVTLRSEASPDRARRAGGRIRDSEAGQSADCAQPSAQSAGRRLRRVHWRRPPAVRLVCGGLSGFLEALARGSVPGYLVANRAADGWEGEVLGSYRTWT